jgi:hypothetical protein
MNTKTEATICILAAFFVLSSILIDAHVALGLAFIFLIAMAIYKLSQIGTKNQDTVF